MTVANLVSSLTWFSDCTDPPRTARGCRQSGACGAEHVSCRGRRGSAGELACVTLANTHLRLDVAPSLGGGITRFDWRSDGALVPIFRRCRHVAANTDPNELACYPMLPYSNRIGGGHFGVGERRVEVPRNRAAEPLPIHGDGWLATLGGGRVGSRERAPDARSPRRQTLSPTARHRLMRWKAQRSLSRWRSKTPGAIRCRSVLAFIRFLCATRRPNCPRPPEACGCRATTGCRCVTCRRRPPGSSAWRIRCRKPSSIMHSRAGADRRRWFGRSGGCR